MIQDANTKTDSEEWRPVYGYEQFYQVSNLGRVRRDGRVLKYKPNKKHRYVHINLSAWKVVTTIAAHRLVAEAFIPNPHKHPHVNHLNGVRHDNRVENLEWCTHKENIRHAYRTGLTTKARGEKSHSAKLTQKSVDEIRMRLAAGERQNRIAKNFSVSQSAIHNIKTGHTWNLPAVA